MSAPDGPPPGMPPGGMPPMPPVPDIPADGPVKVGVFVPSGVPDVDPRVLRDWARLIDAGPWSSLAVTDRVAYANLDPLMTLAMLAPLTERVTLSTSILLPGLRDPHTLAKQVASLVRMAPGRVSLGVGVGARPWDYEATGHVWEERGRKLDRAMEVLLELRDRPSEQHVGPRLGDLEILVGGASGPAMRRMVAYGDGYVAGGIKPEFFAFEAAAALGTWVGAGRPGRPRIVAGSWVARSPDPDDAASRWLSSFFRTGGPPIMVNAGVWRGADGVREQIETYAAQGADEVVLFPCVADLAELEWLTEVVAALPEIKVGTPTPRPPTAPPPAVVPGTADVVVGGGRPE
ncbi:MAG TPA: LLM class flavin-dependent oxidoreductase [Geodermatophilus sp.]|nr:LLM class flavin-dependent oxidoreductase [Geodermatophilus sp.]